MISDSAALYFDQRLPSSRFEQKPRSSIPLEHQQTKRKNKAATSAITNHLNGITPIPMPTPHTSIIPEHMHAAIMESKTLLNQLTTLTHTPYRTNAEKNQVKKILFNQCKFYMMKVYDHQSKQSYQKPKMLLVLETTLGNIPYSIPLSLEMHDGQVVLTERSDLIYQIDQLEHKEALLEYKKTPLTLRTQEKYALLDCIKKLDVARTSMNLPSLFHTGNTLLESLYQGAEQRMERYYAGDITSIKNRTTDVLQVAQLKHRAHSKTWGADYFDSVFLKLISPHAISGTRIIHRANADDNKTPPSEPTSPHSASTTEEDIFFDCHESDEDTEQQINHWMRTEKNTIKTLVEHHLQKQALANDGMNAMSLNHYTSEIDMIGGQLREKIKRIESSMHIAQDKHKEIIDQSNREMQERVTKGLLLTCVVIAACVAPVAAIPVFAAIALSGVATPVALAGIALFAQLVAWVFRKSTLEPIFLNRLKIRQADHPANGTLSKEQMHHCLRNILSTTYAFFGKQKADFENRYPISSCSINNPVFSNEIKNELMTLIKNQSINLQSQEEIHAYLAKAVETVLDDRLKAKQDFIEHLQKSTHVEDFYPYAELSSTWLESNNITELSEFFEKQLWAQYILNNHIGDTDYRFTSRLEPVIIDRLENLGILTESHSKKSFFFLKKIAKQTPQALREWAIAFYNPMNQHLSIYNRLDQVMQTIEQKMPPLPKMVSHTEKLFYREQFVQFKTV